MLFPELITLAGSTLDADGRPGDMLFMLVDGRPVVITRCPCCRRSVRVRWPERWGFCAADVAENEATLA